MRVSQGSPGRLTPCPHCPLRFSTEQSMASHLMDALGLAAPAAVTRASLVFRDGARQEKRVAKKDGPLVVFVPGRLTNPKNVSGMGLWKHRRYMKTWRDRTSQYLLVASLAYKDRHWPWAPSEPKRVMFTAYTIRVWDDDGLAFGLASVRDALKDMQLIDDDAPKCGHRFEYRQRRERGRLGVEISIGPCGQGGRG